MTDLTTPTQMFAFSVIRLVPDPIKDEAINVGVVVTRDTGEGGVMRAKPDVRSRLRAVQRHFSYEAYQTAIRDLAAALGINLQLTFGEPGRGIASRTLLEAISARLNNQLQLTQPRAYLAENIDDALERLYRRYVARRQTTDRKERPLTHAALKDRIWREVQKWNDFNLRVEQGGLLQGSSASHPADVRVLNGHARAALFAVPLHGDDRNLAYLYRDSLPTIAEDMGPTFRVYAILPPDVPDLSPAEQQFAVETRKLLESHAVRTEPLTHLDRIKGEVVEMML